MSKKLWIIIIILFSFMMIYPFVIDATIFESSLTFKEIIITPIVIGVPSSNSLPTVDINVIFSYKAINVFIIMLIILLLLLLVRNKQINIFFQVSIIFIISIVVVIILLNNGYRIDQMSSYYGNISLH